MSGAKAFVYAIQHSETGKIYVGCTNDVERRVREHLSQLENNKHPNKRMQNDYNKYGGDYFYYVLFNAYAAYDAFMMERHFMSLLGTRDETRGYNAGDNSLEFSLDNFKRHNAKDLKVKTHSQHAKSGPRDASTLHRLRGDDSCKIREWLQRERIEKRLTMDQMAKLLNITTSYYSLIESGKRQKKMDASLACKLSAALEIPVEEVFRQEAMLWSA